MLTELQLHHKRMHKVAKRRKTRPKGPRIYATTKLPSPRIEITAKVPPPEPIVHPETKPIPTKRANIFSRVKSFSRRIMGK
jgi:hypothetical protein